MTDSLVEPSIRSRASGAESLAGPPFDLELVIVSHVVHFRSGGRLYAYAPYAREIEVWADLFRSIVIAAPLRPSEPTTDAAPLRRTNIRMSPVRETGGGRRSRKLLQVLSLPWVLIELHMALRSAEAIHVRCPGNLGLLGALMAPLYSHRLVAKYAGQWGPYEGEARTVRLQRAVLASGWWKGPVTVYGQFPDQPAHVVPFFTSMLTEAQIERCRQAVAQRTVAPPRRLLFVGRLTRAKNVQELLQAFAHLVAHYPELQLTIVGDGPEAATLRTRAAELGLAGSVIFTGGLDFEQVLEHYEAADLLVLASATEGWPKALVEAMAFGLLCIGSNRGQIPHMLDQGRGLLVEPGDVEGLTRRLRSMLDRPNDAEAMAQRADWAQQHNLEGLGRALQELLGSHWGTD